MVFRGKPSKACARCRVRRLKCDLHSGTCGQCVRASEPCSGYRDTQQLRIRNESLSVVRKALKNVHPFEPQSRLLSTDLQARDAFFAYHVTGTSKCWDFLKEYYYPTDSPDDLTLAIDAVSLAYLWHQVYSDSALAIARERYVRALRMINQTLRSSEEAAKLTTLLASLLLDLYEKITDSEPQDIKSWTSHVNGALTIVRLRGLEQFQELSEFHVLVRLSANYIFNCIAGGSAVPDELITIRAYIAKHLNPQDPMYRLLELMIRYANLRSEVQRGILSNDEHNGLSMELDINLQALELDMPPLWQYSTRLLEHKSDRTFDLHFDTYSHRKICLARNVIRMVRILLNKSLIDHYSASPTDDKYLALTGVARDNIETLASEICASVPQYMDCDGAARHKLPLPAKSKLPAQNPDHTIPDRNPKPTHHSHTLEHQADCYSLILPLYAVGTLSAAFPALKPWALTQLRHMSSHFHVRNAQVVARILERDTDVCPWKIYALLGGYAVT